MSTREEIIHASLDRMLSRSFQIKNSQLKARLDDVQDAIALVKNEFVAQAINSGDPWAEAESVLNLCGSLVATVGAMVGPLGALVGGLLGAALGLISAAKE